MSDAANTQATEAADDDDLAVLAAMSLMLDNWSIEDTARALKRSVEWVRLAIDEAHADADASDRLPC